MYICQLFISIYVSVCSYRLISLLLHDLYVAFCCNRKFVPINFSVAETKQNKPITRVNLINQCTSSALNRILLKQWKCVSRNHFFFFFASYVWLIILNNSRTRFPNYTCTSSNTFTQGVTLILNYLKLIFIAPCAFYCCTARDINTIIKISSISDLERMQ